jgi:uncharacterized metal-binding protein (TIGR02443 family)
MKYMTWLEKRGASIGASMCSQSKTIVQGDGTFAKRIAAGKCPKCKTSVTSFTHSFDQGDYWECITCGLKMKHEDLK